MSDSERLAWIEVLAIATGKTNPVHKVTEAERLSMIARIAERRTK